MSRGELRKAECICKACSEDTIRLRYHQMPQTVQEENLLLKGYLDQFSGGWRHNQKRCHLLHIDYPVKTAEKICFFLRIVFITQESCVCQIGNPGSVL